MWDLRVVALGYDPAYGDDRRTVQYAAYVLSSAGSGRSIDLTGITSTRLLPGCTRVLLR